MNEVLDHPFWGTAKVGNHVEGGFLVSESVRIVSSMTENSGIKYFVP